MGEVITEPESLMRVWADHFSELCKSRAVSMPGLADLQDKIELMASQSIENEELFLDDPFTTEEVVTAVSV